MLPFLNESMVFVSATKGLENSTLLRMSEVIKEVLPARVAVISGPTFALEVARFEPTALVVASTDGTLAETIQAAFSAPPFPPYANLDTVGVEIGGSVKNVVAIRRRRGCTVWDLGHNAHGCADHARLGGNHEAGSGPGRCGTDSGRPCGLGDLVLTCSGDLSRNRMVGVELAHGRKLEEIVSSMKMVARV